MERLPFRHSKISQNINPSEAAQLDSFIRKHSIWLQYVGCYNSYALRRYDFKIIDPRFATPKVVNDLARYLGIVLATNNVTATIDRDKVVFRVPKEDRGTLYLGDGLNNLLIDDEATSAQAYIGEYDDGTPAYLDFTRTPHFIITGMSGSGKSVCINNILLSLMYKYGKTQAKFFLIDMKGELDMYSDCPQVIETASTYDEATDTLYKIHKEFSRRCSIINNNAAKAGTKGRNLTPGIDLYNKTHVNKLPHVYILIDEANQLLTRDTMYPDANLAREVIRQVAEQGRSLGMHIILVSHKPILKNIDSNVKSAFCGRIAFRAECSRDSVVAIDCKGANKLTGKGDALVRMMDINDGAVKRVQCAFTDVSEREKAIKQLCKRKRAG